MGREVQTILNAKVANGTDNSILVEDYGNAILALATASSANMVIKFYGSTSEVAPTFTSAQSVSNMYDTVQVIDLENGSAIDGDTGITLSGTDDFRMLEMNTNHLRWVTAIISSYSAGAATLTLKSAKLKD